MKAGVRIYHFEQRFKEKFNNVDSIHIRSTFPYIYKYIKRAYLQYFTNLTSYIIQYNIDKYMVLCKGGMYSLLLYTI